MPNLEENSLIQLSLEGEYSVIPNDMQKIHMVAEVVSLEDKKGTPRPNLSIIFVLDTSGSMAGEPLQHVIEAVDCLCSLLEPKDKVGVVSFASWARQEMPLNEMSTATKKALRACLQRIRASGNTNIEAALQKAASMFPPKQSNERQIILLLSDGEPNEGLCSPSDLASIAANIRKNVSISTLGFGLHHHEDILTSISDGGGGKYYFIADPAICSLQFANALGNQANVIAENVELVLLPSSDVEISKLLGKYNPRVGSYGMTIPLPDLIERAQRLIVAELSLRCPKERKTWEIVTGNLNYRKTGTTERVSIQKKLQIQLGEKLSDVIIPTHHKVLLVQCDEIRLQARSLADKGQYEIGAALLKKMLDTIQKAPGFVKGNGSQLAEAYEHLLDEALMLERKPKKEEYTSFRHSQMSESLSTEATIVTVPVTISKQSSQSLHASRFYSTPLSQSLSESISGPLPKASLEIIGGSNDGQHFVLSQARCLIGRTSSADFIIPDPSISRSHAQIFARKGMFLIQDLGTRNGTYINGQRISSDSSCQLKNGDIIGLGNVKLRYHQKE